MVRRTSNERLAMDVPIPLHLHQSQHGQGCPSSSCRQFKSGSTEAVGNYHLHARPKTTKNMTLARGGIKMGEGSLPDGTCSRKSDQNLNETTRKAELVPALNLTTGEDKLSIHSILKTSTHHARAELHIVVNRPIRHPVHPNLQRPIRSRDYISPNQPSPAPLPRKMSEKRRTLMRIIPLQIIRSPIMQIHRLPEWIISWPKSPPILLKLVTEHKHELLSPQIWWLGVCRLGCVLVDEPHVPDELRDLPRSIDPPKVEPAAFALLSGSKVCDERIAWWGVVQAKTVTRMPRDNQVKVELSAEAKQNHNGQQRTSTTKQVHIMSDDAQKEHDEEDLQKSHDA